MQIAELRIVRDLDVSYAQGLVIRARGLEAFEEQRELHEPTLMHGLRVGQLVGNTLRAYGVSESTCEAATQGAALHDVFKFHRLIRRYIMSDLAFDPPTRKFITNGHTRGGYYKLMNEGLLLPAFVAGNHHADSVPDYRQNDPNHMWGITHLTMVFDVLDALLDPTRLYIRKREGRVLGSDDIFNIVMKRRGDFNPVVEGHDINIPRALGRFTISKGDLRDRLN